MPNINAPIQGIPSTAQVDIVLRYPLQQLGPAGLPAAEYRLRSTDGGATYLDRSTNAAPDVPAAGETDPYPTDPVEAEITVTVAGRARTSTMYLLPVQIGGVLDLAQPLTPVGWVAPVTLSNLITTLSAAGEAAQEATTAAQEAAAAAQDATTNLNAVIGGAAAQAMTAVNAEWADTKVDIAQATDEARTEVDRLRLVNNVEAADIALLLRQWTQAEAYEPTAITRNADGLVTSATVKWPDGSAGTLTATNYNATHGVYDGFTITHATGKTITQSAVTRDNNGAVTVKPALTVTP